MTGDKVYLRALEPEDVELLYRWENDPDTWHVTGTKAPFSKRILQDYVESVGDLFTDGQLRTIICLREAQRPVGTIDLFEHDAVNRRAGVGILVAAPEDRGQGYAREALSLLMHHAFERLGLHQLYCNVGVRNEASLKLFESAGFRRVGRKAEWVRSGDGWEDEFLLQCLEEEHRAIREKEKKEG